MTLEPLYGLKDRELAEFVTRLSEEQKEDLVRAYHYYMRVLTGLGRQVTEKQAVNQ